MGLYAQQLALAMLGVIPLFYLLGYFTIKEQPRAANLRMHLGAVSCP